MNGAFSAFLNFREVSCHSTEEEIPAVQVTLVVSPVSAVSAILAQVDHRLRLR